MQFLLPHYYLRTWNKCTFKNECVYLQDYFNLKYISCSIIKYFYFSLI